MLRKLLLAAVVVAVLVAGALVVAAREQPLMIGSQWTGDTRYRQGGPFFFGFVLQNDGRVPVTVTGVSASDRGLFRTTGVGFARPRDPARISRPLEPFRLSPGDGEEITVAGRFAGCGRYVAGGSVTQVSVRVRYEVLGLLPRSARVELSSPFTVRRPDECPEPRAGP